MKKGLAGDQIMGLILNQLGRELDKHRSLKNFPKNLKD